MGGAAADVTEVSPAPQESTGVPAWPSVKKRTSSCSEIKHLLFQTRNFANRGEDSAATVRVSETPSPTRAHALRAIL